MSTNASRTGMNTLLISLVVISGNFAVSCSSSKIQVSEEILSHARENAGLANEGFGRCRDFVSGWLANADPETGLIPRNLEQNPDIWNAQDSAADNYPFMVLTASIIDRPLYDGRMLSMLNTEQRLTSRIGPLPDTYSFTKRGFADETPDMGRIVFGSSEYVKDGLLPLTEWLPPGNPWTERMIEILDGLWERAPVNTPFGAIVSDSHEINGEMLQTLSRVYFMTGDEKYLDWAIRLGDYYLLGDHHPTRDTDRLRLRDHGCEIVSGLCELYAASHFSRPEKKEAYRAPLYTMLDRILQVGRNSHGLFYNIIDPKTGEIVNDGVADTWGYTLNGYYTVYLVDGHEPYREAVLKALGTIDVNYRSYDWERGSADGYADAIESALNLYNREPVQSAASWIDSEIQVMWGKQRPDGVIEGWHGDGNFARTTIMYCLWKTQGITVKPWREDVRFGAVRDGDRFVIVLKADREWNGRIVFDVPRHRETMHLPIDWPRINQFPEWFVAEDNFRYEIVDTESSERNIYNSREMTGGIPIVLDRGVERCFAVVPVRSE